MNTPESIQIGKSRALAARCVYYTLQVLSEQDGGCIQFQELKKRLTELIDLDDWELYIYPNSGSVRWVVNLQYYSIDLVKAGYLVKNHGEWRITDDGLNVYIKYKGEPFKLFAHTHKKYMEWVKSNKSDVSVEHGEAAAIENVPHSIVLDSVRQQANDDLRIYMKQRTPWEFQDMVAALLRSMGYYTPFVAPKGKDGGVDIIAYSDPLGATRPILKVQVKHYAEGNNVPVDVVHNIIGVAKNDTPIVVTSGRFTTDAINTARVNNVRLIDGTEFAELWIAYYNKMTEDDKLLMPIEPVYFVKRTE